MTTTSLLPGTITEDRLHATSSRCGGTERVAHLLADLNTADLRVSPRTIANTVADLRRDHEDGYGLRRDVAALSTLLDASTARRHPWAATD